MYGSGLGRTLALETSGGVTPAGDVAHPHFFSGFLTAPTAAAAGLLAVADVAAARYPDPPRDASLDPVVTAAGDRLRFESFSNCCGVYARLDVLESGLDGDDIGHGIGHGTTNVDVNPPLRQALGRLGGLDPLHLVLGPEELTVKTFDGEFLEKRVPLPERWLRGFAEAQVLTAGFALRAELPAADAAAVLRALPRPTRGFFGRATQWVVPTGRTLRPTTRQVPGAVCLPGPERLLTMLPVLRHASTVRVYAPADAAGEAAVAWEAELPGMRLTLLLSPGIARGFSGEGGVLHDLVDGSVEADAERVAELLAWEPRIDVTELAAHAGLSAGRVREALTMLGTSGQIGYDLAEAAYFHRHLPYHPDAAQTRNPRLRGARRLVAEGAVRLDGALARVGRGEGAHVVRAGPGPGELSCTCPWWAKHRGGRGPCKHVLAVAMVRGTRTER